MVRSSRKGVALWDHVHTPVYA